MMKKFINHEKHENTRKNLFLFLQNRLDLL